MPGLQSDAVQGGDHALPALQAQGAHPPNMALLRCLCILAHRVTSTVKAWVRLASRGHQLGHRLLIPTEPVTDKHGDHGRFGSTQAAVEVSSKCYASLRLLLLCAAGVQHLQDDVNSFKQSLGSKCCASWLHTLHEGSCWRNTVNGLRTSNLMLSFEAQVPMKGRSRALCAPCRRPQCTTRR